MTSKTHTLIGVGAATIVCTGLSLPFVPVIAGSLIGSLLPDIDHPRAKINQKLLIFKNKLTLQITFILIGAAAFLYGSMVFKMVGVFLILTALSAHRQFTHSVIGLFSFLGICCVAAQFYTGNIKNFVLGLIIGYIIHIVTDCMSNHGIELLFPISKKHLALPLVRTGGLSEMLFLFISIALILIVLQMTGFDDVSKMKLF